MLKTQICVTRPQCVNVDTLHVNSGQKVTLRNIYTVVACSVIINMLLGDKSVIKRSTLHKVIKNDRRGFNNLSYTVHLR